MDTNRERGRRSGGFTLIEILVVLTIISILAGLSMYGLLKARKSGQETAVQSDIHMLGARIENFKNAFGYYPPSSLSSIGINGNNINDGNESLFAFLTTRKKGGPFADDLKEEGWVNADGDSLSQQQAKIVKDKVDWIRGTNDLLEYVDFWGNPYVYINARDYGKTFKYQPEGGVVFQVQACKNPTTATYCAPTRYQLWSLGPDGINQNGTGDDIVSWK